MTGIVFYFEPYEVDVWSGKNFDAWNYAVKAAGDITSAVIINRTDQKFTSFDRGMDVSVVDSLEAADLQGRVAYFIPPWETFEHSSVSEILWDFKHGVDWYVFGPAVQQRWWPDDAYVVTVPQAGRGAMHSVHVASCVMLHRFWTKFK